jgi:hypothetical protein
MTASITAAVANQRNAELVAEADARRLILAARDGRPHRESSRRSQTRRFRRRPLTALASWIGAGQL